MNDPLTNNCCLGFGIRRNQLMVFQSRSWPWHQFQTEGYGLSTTDWKEKRMFDAIYSIHLDMIRATLLITCLISTRSKDGLDFKTDVLWSSTETRQLILPIVLWVHHRLKGKSVLIVAICCDYVDLCWSDSGLSHGVCQHGVNADIKSSLHKLPTNGCLALPECCVILSNPVPLSLRIRTKSCPVLAPPAISLAVGCHQTGRLSARQVVPGRWQMLSSKWSIELIVTWSSWDNSVSSLSHPISDISENLRTDSLYGLVFRFYALSISCWYHLRCFLWILQMKG